MLGLPPPSLCGLLGRGDVIVEEGEELHAFPDIAAVNDELVLLRLCQAEDGAVVVVELVRVLERHIEGIAG